MSGSIVALYLAVGFVALPRRRSDREDGGGEFGRRGGLLIQAVVCSGLPASCPSTLDHLWRDNQSE